ncbi:uncharacterized protein LOC115623087 [Scaptodrosophila lebanonensis]|uniref:Uncharacterized protein LOC115623087 n=1 Tax=Drosophila lebanonensis TaxID=7225 RepID=A0A6J2TDT0_DROLE|nr:uncharacterized protein LOC115623087 [Scaptodrosophila lebanonensis]
MPMKPITGKNHSVRTLHPGYHGDGDEDPCKRGILRNTSCRRYREQLRNARHTNILQGVMVVTCVATVIALLLLQSMEMIAASDTEQASGPADDRQLLTRLWSLWLSVSNFLVSDVIGESTGFLEDNVASEPSQPIQPIRSYYCNQRLDTKNIFEHIRKQVINQEQALARFERAMHSDRQFKSLALLGPPGVGKTLTAIALRQHFPWPENIHAYSWSTYVPDEVRKFHMVRHFVEQLSDCGQNLLIIDNLSTCDYSIVPIYNQLILEREGERNAAANQSVLVVYIFNLETEHYWEQFELLQQLPSDTTIISYRPFGREELMDCLENELQLEQRVLSQRALSCILDETDVYATGCKRLRQLILQYGRPEID